MSWNYTEFKTYLLLEAAHADMSFSQEEQDLIVKKINKETYDKIYAEFREDTDFQRIEKIGEASKTFLDTSDKKLELIEKIRTLFQSDGEYDTMEHNMMMFLKKIL